MLHQGLGRAGSDTEGTQEQQITAELLGYSQYSTPPDACLVTVTRYEL